MNAPAVQADRNADAHPGRAIMVQAAVEAFAVLRRCMVSDDLQLAFNAANNVFSLINACMRHGHGFVFDWDVDPAVDDPVPPPTNPPRRQPAPAQTLPIEQLMNPPPEIWAHLVASSRAAGIPDAEILEFGRSIAAPEEMLRELEARPPVPTAAPAAIPHASRPSDDPRALVRDTISFDLLRGEAFTAPVRQARPRHARRRRARNRATGKIAHSSKRAVSNDCNIGDSPVCYTRGPPGTALPGSKMESD